jgi:hypothetical protein
MSNNVGRATPALDVSAAFANAPDRESLYLTPTTLSPQGVAFLADAMAERIREQFPFLDAPLVEYEARPATITQADGSELTIQQVYRRGSQEVVEPTHQTRLVLIGDRNVGVYSDPALGLGQYAGLGEHLSRALGRPLQWHWRDMLPKDAIVELIKQVDLDQATVVVWVLPVEELRSARWGALPVPPIPNRGQPDRLVVQAKIVTASPPPAPDLREQYPDTINYTLWEIQKVVEGQWPHKELLTVEWSQKDLNFLHPFHYEPGEEFTLELQPLNDAVRRDRSISRADRVDAIQRGDLPPFWITAHQQR